MNPSNGIETNLKALYLQYHPSFFLMNPSNGIETAQKWGEVLASFRRFFLMNPSNGIETFS